VLVLPLWCWQEGAGDRLHRACIHTESDEEHKLDVVAAAVYNHRELQVHFQANVQVLLQLHFWLQHNLHLAGVTRNLQRQGCVMLLLLLPCRCSAGIACSKLLSKLVSGLHKPDDQTTILPTQAQVRRSCRATEGRLSLSGPASIIY